MEFEEIDSDRFPAIRLAKETIHSGATAGAIFNASNEVAVEAFLAGAISFGRISEIVEETGVEMKLRPADSFPAILAADQEAREIAHARIGVASKP